MHYSLKKPFYKSSLAIAVTGAILSGCGGGSDGGASSVSGGGQTTSSVALSGLVTGRVADGYIMGATAFLDIDGDKQLDSWEPSQKTEVLDTTVSTNAVNLGKFEVDLATWFDELSADNKAAVLGYLQDAGLSIADGTTLTAGDLMSAFSVVVDIPADAVDADKPTETIGSAIKLAAPPKPKVSGSTSSDADTFISPITTVLDQKVTAKKKELKEKEALGLTVTEDEKDVTLLVSAAKKEVKTDLGLADDETSDQLLTGDYIDAKADAAKADLAKKLHTVAKVTTTLLAKGVNDTTGGSDNTIRLDDATRQAIIDAVTEKVLAQLKTIAAVSQKIVDEGGDEDVASIDVNKISEKAQEVAAEDTSGESDAASLTEVTVDQDEIEAAKEATEQAQQDDPADDTTDTVLTAFLSDTPKQIVRGTADNTLAYRVLGLAKGAATWAIDATLPETSAVTTSVLDQDTGEWVEVSVASSISGTTQTLTFTPTTSTAETPVAESGESVKVAAAITADTPLTLNRTLSGTVTDLAGKSIRAQVGVPNWKEKITAGTTFTNGTSNPQRARLVAQSASSVTLKLADTLSYNGLKAQVVDGTVSFTDSAGNTVTSFITDTVTASDGAFTVPADIAARFNVPVDQRDWVDVAGTLGYQLGKNPVIFDWFNATAFDQIATEALNTDGLVNSPNLVASLSGDTVTVNAASLLIPDGYSLSTFEAVKPALYGVGEVLTVSNGNQFSLIKDETARVTLTYSKADAEDITQTGYIHRGKDTADNMVAGRDYKVRSKIQWNPDAVNADQTTGAYEHALEVLLRESRYADLKAATMSAEAIIGTSEAPETYQVEGIYRVYGPKTVAAGTAPAFDRDGTGETAAENITLPSVPTTKPADLSSVTAENITFDGKKLSFSSLTASGVPNATDICFELSMTVGTDTVKKLECSGKPSDTGSYTIDPALLGVNILGFSDISVSAVTLNETIEGLSIEQQVALIPNALSLPEPGSLTYQALMGHTLYLTQSDGVGGYTYFVVAFDDETGSWNISKTSEDGLPLTADAVRINGNQLRFSFNGVDSILELNTLTTDNISDVKWTQGAEEALLEQQPDRAAFDAWKEKNTSKKLYSSLFRTTDFATSANCTSGGYKVESGFDLNANKLLDTDEISLSQEVCNGEGSAISVTALTSSSPECSGLGGTKLDIAGQDPILLCNSDGIPRNYLQAEQLVRGLGSWVSALENHARDVASSVDSQTNALAGLVSAEGIDSSMMALGLAIESLDLAYAAFRDNAETVSTSYNVADLIPSADRPEELQSLSGSVTVNVNTDGTISGLSLTGFSVDLDRDPLDTLGPVTASVTLTSATLPDEDTSATSFVWKLADVVASTETGRVSAPIVEAALLTENAVTLTGSNVSPGLTTLSLNLGSEIAPVKVETLNAPEGAASDVVFTGALNLTAVVKQEGYQASPMIAPQSVNFNFDGQLSYDNQQVKVDLALDAPKIYQQNVSVLQAAFPVLDNLNSGDTLNGFYSITAVDALSESVQEHPETFTSSTLDSLVRYESSNIIDSDGLYRPLAIATVIDSSSGTAITTYKIWEANYDELASSYSYSASYDLYSGGSVEFSNLNDAESYVLRKILADGRSLYLDETGSMGYTYLWLETLINDRESGLEIEGSYNLSQGLPVVGSSLGYDLIVANIYYDTPLERSFENHSQYTVSANIGLQNLKDSTGVVLPDANLNISANRQGYSYRSMGEFSFTLTLDGQSMTARYDHADLLTAQFDDYPMDDGLFQGGRGFSFSDNQGGLIQFDLNREINCDYDRIDENRDHSCLLGGYRFRVIVNGSDHGYIWQSMDGRWIAVLGDGDPNVQEQEQDEFVVYTPY